MIRKESSNRRQVLVDICVSAYPDLCPWQVRQAVLEPPVGEEGSKNNKQFDDLYYYYLSSLLHPQDGHYGTKHDKDLVKVSSDFIPSESAESHSYVFFPRLNRRNGAHYP